MDSNLNLLMFQDPRMNHNLKKKKNINCNYFTNVWIAKIYKLKT